MTEPTSIPPETIPLPAPRRYVATNVVYSILQRAQGALFYYAALRLILAAMSVEDYGFYSLLFAAFLADASQLLQLGVPSLLVRFIPEFYVRKQFRSIHRLFRTVNRLQMALWGVLLILAVVLASPLAEMFRIPGGGLSLRMFAIGVFSYLLQENYRVVLGALFRQSVIFWVILAHNICRLAAIFFVTQYAFSFMAVIAAESAVMLLTLVFYWIAYRRVMSRLLVESVDDTEPIVWKRYVRYTSLSYLNEVGVLVVGGLDLFFVSGLLGVAAVGLYGLVNRIISMAYKVLPHSMLNSLIQPLFFSEFGDRAKSSPESGFSMLTKMIAMATFPLTAWLALMAQPIIVHLFEPKYAAAAPILVIFAFSLSVMNFKMPIGLVLQAVERVDLLIYVKIIGVFKIAAILWLVPEGGLLTMAWIALASTTLDGVFAYYFMHRASGVTGDLLGLLRLLINVIVTAVLFFPLRGLLDSVVGVIAAAPIIALIFFGLSYLNKAFSTTERDWLNAKFKRKLWVF